MVSDEKGLTNKLELVFKMTQNYWLRSLWGGGGASHIAIRVEVDRVYRDHFAASTVIVIIVMQAPNKKPNIETLLSHPQHGLIVRPNSWRMRSSSLRKGVLACIIGA